MPANYTEIEKRLWEAADELRANSKLKPSEYSVPVLGLIFLLYADYKFALVEQELTASSSRRRTVGKTDYQAKGALFVPETARFDYLLNLPEAEDIGGAINGAMKAIADENEELGGALPRDYNRLEKPILRELLKILNRIPREGITEDAFGEIYQYFLGNFAQKEGQKGGEFFTSTSLVKWIQLFYSALNQNGRAGFVMANSASDARGSELEIRRQLIATGAVDVMIAIGSNFFYTVTLPCTLWFLDRGKVKTPRKEKVLFVDARHIYRQVDRAHRDFSEQQVELIANIVRLYRGKAITSVETFLQETFHRNVSTSGGIENQWENLFPEGAYQDVAGLCKVATLAEIEAQGWSLNPGRYVGVAERKEAEDFDFAERLEELNEELEILNVEARELEERIAENVAQLLNL